MRTHVPWHIRLAGLAGVVALLAMLAGWSYDAGRRIAGFDRGETTNTVEELRNANAALEEEAARLRSLLAASESNLHIELSAQRMLSEKSGALALENLRLKEDLAVFERLAGLEGRNDQEVSLDRPMVSADATPGSYRFSFLIALQGDRRGKESVFDLQVVAVPRAGSTNVKIALPGQGETNASQYKVALRNFRRIEGKFALPPDFPVGTVEFRILERGILKASASAKT